MKMKLIEMFGMESDQDQVQKPRVTNQQAPQTQMNSPELISLEEVSQRLEEIAANLQTQNNDAVEGLVRTASRQVAQAINQLSQKLKMDQAQNQRNSFVSNLGQKLGA